MKHRWRRTILSKLSQHSRDTIPPIFRHLQFFKEFPHPAVAVPAGNKFQQLWYQLFNKEKIGVMGRLDIPVQGDNTQLAIDLAQKFIRDLGRGVPEDDAEYMFGK
jgi:hypothetical protein